jgi:hypothetical protein
LGWAHDIVKDDLRTILAKQIEHGINKILNCNLQIVSLLTVSITVKIIGQGQGWIGSPNFGGIFFQGAPKKI